jgi:hypothetical protein
VAMAGGRESRTMDGAARMGGRGGERGLAAGMAPGQGSKLATRSRLCYSGVPKGPHSPHRHLARGLHDPTNPQMHHPTLEGQMITSSIVLEGGLSSTPARA